MHQPVPLCPYSFENFKNFDVFDDQFMLIALNFLLLTKGLFLFLYFFFKKI
jgi:hypothetical protein